LASTPAKKAAVHVALAQKRVEEAETLAQRGTLTASTSAALVANFESNAQSADDIATEIEASDPAVAVQIKTELSASSEVGGAVLAALGKKRGNREDTKEHAGALAIRVAARAQSEKALSFASGRGDGAAAPKTAVRAAAMTTLRATATAEPETTVNVAQESMAARLEEKAQEALDAARKQYAVASSTLGTTTVEVEATLADIESLMSDGARALGSLRYDAAIKDFTQALGRALRLRGLLKAQQSFNEHTIVPLLKFREQD
ncbi:MAG: hypothetical protein AAB919_00385, partial [Patescibacteria group bacterium]